jgi:hypothetical protein
MHGNAHVSADDVVVKICGVHPDEWNDLILRECVAGTITGTTKGSRFFR